MKTIIFHSYKGGTGKTTIALNIAMQLAQNGYKVLAVDADIGSPTFDSLFLGGLKNYYINDFFEYDLDQPKEKPASKTLTPFNVKDLLLPGPHENLQLIYAKEQPKFGQGLLSMDKDFHKNALKQLYVFKSEIEKLGYDFLIMDTSPSLNLFSINTIIIADAAILVLRPNRYGFSGTTFLLKELYALLGTLNRKDYILFNQVIPNSMGFISAWEKRFQEEFNVETIGVIQCDCSLALEMLYGQIFNHLKNTDFRKTIEEIINRLINDLEVK
ncbi:MAG: hypothetical protein DRP02_03095 [Candidatus Gerdarchaeota archaeon]|nr:MAG: hypothetical protein DRP02_03095 [Candidatus Gerdarchaeota archaeon]